MLVEARELRARLGEGVKLIMNDRADLCLAAGFRRAARRAGRPVAGVGAARDWRRPLAGCVHAQSRSGLRWRIKPPRTIWRSGRSSRRAAKRTPSPWLGSKRVRRARELTRKPLVAIGGITRANARSVIEAGADAVAVISDLIRDPGKSAEEFFRLLR